MDRFFALVHQTSSSSAARWSIAMRDNVLPPVIVIPDAGMDESFVKDLVALMNEAYRLTFAGDWGTFKLD